jgi:acetylornithine deacetylase
VIIDANLLKLVSQMIEIPSVSGDERTILAWLTSALEHQTFDEVHSTDLFVAGRLRGSSSDTAIVLCGHVDTVSAGDEQSWTTSPWNATVCGTSLRGLGSTDMKGGFAAQLCAAIDCRSVIDRDVWIVGVAEEETTGAGSQSFNRWFSDRYAYTDVQCVIAEPTDLDRIEVGHRGNMFVNATWNGPSGHGSDQDLYIPSAMHGAAQFLVDVPNVVDGLDVFADELLGHPSVVATSIIAGSDTSPNKIAGQATVVLDIRTTPTFEREAANWLEQLGHKYGFTYGTLHDPIPAALCPSDALIVRQLAAASGVEKLSASRGATDQVFFQNCGIPTVVFGPGTFDLAHTRDESIELDLLQQSYEMFCRLLRGQTVSDAG